MTTVVIADDHAIFRQGLESLLGAEESIQVVGCAADGQTALELIRTHRPDIAVLDVSMPGKGGIEIAEEVARQGLATRVMLLTMHGDAELLQAALAAGAAGYLLKENAFEDLVYALGCVQRGGTFIAPSLAGRAAAQQTSIRSRLTPREQEIIGLIARGMTTRQIADELCISAKTVETHRTRILNKLKARNTADLVRYAVKAGLA